MRFAAVRDPILIVENKLTNYKQKGLIDERYIFGKAEVRLHPIKDWNIYKVTAD